MRNAFPILYTADLPKAVAFYRDLLGFRQTYQFPPEGDSEFVGLEVEGGSLALAQAEPGQTGSHGRPMHPGDRGSFELCMYTDDVDQTINHLRTNGVPVLVEPVDQPWGERMAYIADPDNRPVMICAQPAQSHMQN